ncbi:MAG: phasin family protein [Alphaproteobacteria bacterium]|nr:phasin family protein [Alphaproteobacteria bacterium]
MSKETYSSPFWGENFKGFKDNKFPWLDTDLILSGYRRNMTLITTTQQIAAETTKAVMQLQAQYMKDVFEQLSEQTKKNISAASPEERVAHQSEKAKTAVDQAIEHGRNVNAIITKSNEKIIENVQKRFKEGVDESASLARKTKK